MLWKARVQRDYKGDRPNFEGHGYVSNLHGHDDFTHACYVKTYTLYTCSVDFMSFVS